MTETERQALIRATLRRDYQPVLQMLMCFQGLNALSTEGLRLIARVLDILEEHQRPEIMAEGQGELSMYTGLHEEEW